MRNYLSTKDQKTNSGINKIIKVLIKKKEKKW